MSGTTLLLYFAGMALGIVGLIMLFVSIIPAWRRHGPMWTTLWAPPGAFQGRELLYNRLGFALAVAGIVLLLVSLFQMVR